LSCSGSIILLRLIGKHDRIRTAPNGERRQHGTTSNVIFPIEFLVEYITFVMTLEPGDIISTGTPSGVGPIVAG
ncbi:MAG: fumarylacetoacetate hydrolase family protein, partial [Vicinamibacterales bacterium]